MPVAEAGVRDHALRTLRNLGVEYKVGAFVGVRPEAILYVSGAGRARTCWLFRSGGKLTHRDEAGFPAFPNLEENP